MIQNSHIELYKAIIKIMNLHCIQNTKTFIKFIHQLWLFWIYLQFNYFHFLANKSFTTKLKNRFKQCLYENSNLSSFMVYSSYIVRLFIIFRTGSKIHREHRGTLRKKAMPLCVLATCTPYGRSRHSTP